MNRLEPGTKVIGLKYEFKDTEGKVLKQISENLVAVMFKGCALPVITTRDNLKEVDYYGM